MHLTKLKAHSFMKRSLSLPSNLHIENDPTVATKVLETTFLKHDSNRDGQINLVELTDVLYDLDVEANSLEIMMKYGQNGKLTLNTFVEGMGNYLKSVHQSIQDKHIALSRREAQNGTDHDTNNIYLDKITRHEAVVDDCTCITRERSEATATNGGSTLSIQAAVNAELVADVSKGGKGEEDEKDEHEEDGEEEERERENEEEDGDRERSKSIIYQGIPFEFEKEDN